VAYQVRVERARSLPLAVVRLRARKQELPKVVPEACGTVWRVIRAQQVAGAGRNVAVYLDCEINLEVGVELETPFGGFDEVVDSATPSGLVATTTHFGPYQLLHNAHEAIRQCCAEHGHTMAGPSWEIYGHWKNEWNSDPSKIVTDIYYLLLEDADLATA
jgi:effector-binding domain-containing protein